MNKKLENFIILFDILFWFFIILFYIILYFEGPGELRGLGALLISLAILFLILVPLFILFNILFWKKPINKKNNKIITYISLILLIIELYIIIFIFLSEVLIEPIAVSFSSSKLCALIPSTPSSYVRDDCFKQIAVNNLDESICYKIKEKEIGHKEICFWRVAEAKNDISLCDKAGRYKDYCYESLNRVS